ncbi:hypothetical protein RvY_01375-2 [Ramazzottius varieornatus]|uniref:Uncharacterized protein n=1 Tax=Ramazzottius varieornatus TaxID=947166 RepID=A0A1D1UN84_RAMVA|nr:hypothetical protein RvY_01375-2 [Ramazzottius varieornatus]
MLARPRTIAGVSLVSHRAIIGPGERWMLCLCGSQVRIFSCSTGQLHSVLEETTEAADRLTALVFNPVNPHSQIYTATVSGSILLWDYEDGVLVKKVTSKYPLHGLYVPYRDRGLFLLSEHTERRSSVGSAKDLANRPEDESCALFQLDCIGDISKGSKGRLVCRSLSTDSTKVAFCSRGEYLASINHNSLNIYYFKDEHFKKHLISRNLFTCIAVHPTEQCIATGDTQGRILLWRNFQEAPTVSKTTVHWHSTAVLDIAFSLEGSYMWSGGWESTLVQWSLNNTDQKDFIPRLGAAIVRLSISYDGNIIAVSHSDGGITFISILIERTNSTLSIHS